MGSSASRTLFSGGGTMNITLWILQFLMGIFFIMNGSGKVFCFDDNLWQKVLHVIPWIDGVSQHAFIFIGASEFLGGVGLILPALTKVKPKLAALAAAGLATVMGLATGFHLLRAEYAFAGLTLVLCLIFIFIAYGRFILRPLKEAKISLKSFLVGLGALAATFTLVFFEYTIEHHMGA
jgi:uncharacterized membrane protein YphA (DoxX/SURF4 family)